MTRSHTLVERHLGGFLFRSGCGNKCGNNKHLCPYSYENMNPPISTTVLSVSLQKPCSPKDVLPVPVCVLGVENKGMIRL